MRRIEVLLFPLIAIGCHPRRHATDEPRVRSDLASVSSRSGKASIRPEEEASPSSASADTPSSLSQTIPRKTKGADAAASQFWTSRLKTLYDSYGKNEQARARTFRELFAPQVHRFITLTDIPLDEVIESVESYFGARTNPYYQLRGAAEVSSDSEGKTLAHARVSAQWTEPCKFVWAGEFMECQQRRTLNVEASADQHGRIVELVESPGPPARYRALDETLGYVEPRSHCDQQDAGEARVSVAKGDVLEATGSWVWSPVCGPTGETFGEFTAHGTRFWLLTSYSIRVFTEMGPAGPAVGGDDLIELVE